jgi:hypothetical protein
MSKYSSTFYHDAIVNFTPFTNAPGSFRGAPIGKDRYVVYSYSTLIAEWTREEGWRVSDRKYSATTSKHQGILRRAIRWGLVGTHDALAQNIAYALAVKAL